MLLAARHSCVGCVKDLVFNSSIDSTGLTVETELESREREEERERERREREKESAQESGRHGDSGTLQVLAAN